MALMHDIPNLFVKANFSFTYDGKTHDYINQYISSHGLSGIRWPFCDPRTLVGQPTLVNIELLWGERKKLRTRGVFTAERGKDTTYLGVRFLLDEGTKNEVENAIMEAGTVPTSHIRKYPRIPAQAMISTMPLTAIMTYNGEAMSTQVANISPNGVLLYTENPKASFMDPGQRVKVQLEPRGEFFIAVGFEALVCRILEERDTSSRNVERYLGLHVTRFEPGHKESFLALLQDILLRLKIDLERKRR